MTFPIRMGNLDPTLLKNKNCKLTKFEHRQFYSHVRRLFLVPYFLPSLGTEYFFFLITICCFVSSKKRRLVWVYECFYELVFSSENCSKSSQEIIPTKNPNQKPWLLFWRKTYQSMDRWQRLHWNNWSTWRFAWRKQKKRLKFYWNR